MIQTYQGACHCGQVRFVVEADIDHMRVCDCSVCHRRGALIHRVAKGRLQLSTRWDDLTQYRWGTQTAVDYFCRRCGTLPFRSPSAPTPSEVRAGIKPFDGWAVNVRCLKGVDIQSIPRRLVAGSQL